jgi:hypothetical protein
MGGCVMAFLYDKFEGDTESPRGYTASSESHSATGNSACFRKKFGEEG